MKRYEYQMRELLFAMLKGYGIGIILSALAAASMVSQGLLSNVVTGALGLDLVFGSMATMFFLGSTEVKAGFSGALIGLLKAMFGSLLFSGFFSLNPMFMLFFLLKFMFCLIAASLILVVSIVLFPITVVYTVVMFLIEKFKGPIDDDLGDILDKLVPIGIIALWILAAFIASKIG